MGQGLIPTRACKERVFSLLYFFSVNGMLVLCCCEKIPGQEKSWRVSGTAPKDCSSQSTAAFLSMKAVVPGAMLWEYGEPGCGGKVGQSSTPALNRPNVHP